MSAELDPQLVERARAGDREALEAVLEVIQPHVFRFGMRMCRDREAAKDVLQETLLAMAKGIQDFRGASAVSTWAYTIARSFCLKKRRRSKFAPEDERSLEGDAATEASRLADPSRLPDEALAGKQVEAALEKAIGDLEPMYREVLLLRDVEGLTAPEVSEILGVSVQAVKSRLHRARVAVRAQVAPVLSGESEPSLVPSASCPDVATLFSQHLEGEIGPDLCDTMERHLAACPACRGVCDSLKRTLAVCKSTRAEPVPEPLRLEIRTALRALSRR